MAGEQGQPIPPLLQSLVFKDAKHATNRFECNFSALLIQYPTPAAKSHSSNPDLVFTVSRISPTSFVLKWEAPRLGLSTIATSAISAAELYWLGSGTEHPIRVASTVGPLHPSWPSATGRELNLIFKTKDLDGTILPSGETLDWTIEQSFLARLSFYPVTFVTEQSAPAVPTSSGLHAARNFSSHHLKAEPHDVKFVFKRGEEESCLWTSADILRENCPYFETLFNSDFVEARYFSDKDRSKKRKLEDSVTTTEESIGDELDDNDSDADIDDHLIETSTSNAIPSPSTTLLYYQISIRNASYSTYRVVLMYLQTGHVWFAPLTSSFSHLPVEARSKARLEAISTQQKLEPQLPPPASPKSVYKLAHYLSLPALQSLALAEISRQLSIENVFIELFDGLASVYDEVRRVMVAFAVKHKKEVVETEGFKGVMERLRRNELEFSGPVMADLLPLLVG